MIARVALGLAALLLVAAATTIALISWRGQAMSLALNVWSFCF